MSQDNDKVRVVVGVDLGTKPSETVYAGVEVEEGEVVRVTRVEPPASLIERLAAVAHESWRGWMEWQASPDRTLEDVRRWRRQAKTPYADLPEPEKESDRVEARKYLAVMEAEIAHLRFALELIRDSRGHVCEEFETCDHVGCRDSHGAWEIANRALEDKVLVLCSNCGNWSESHRPEDGPPPPCPHCGFQAKGWVRTRTENSPHGDRDG